MTALGFLAWVLGIYTTLGLVMDSVSGTKVESGRVGPLPPPLVSVYMHITYSLHGWKAGD